MRGPLFLALGMVTAALLAACGAQRTQPNPPAGPTVSPTASASSSAPAITAPRLTPPIGAPRTLVVREQDNGHAVSVQAGDRVQVLLTGTSWELTGSSDPSVLRPAGQPTVSPQVAGCPGGEGCGTFTATYDAVTAGRALVTARRTSCPETQSCAGNLGFYQVTVVVTG